MIRWRTFPFGAVLSAAIAVVVAVTQGWSAWPVLVVLGLAASTGAEIGVWVDRRYVARRAEIEQDLAAAKNELARAQHGLSTATAELVLTQRRLSEANAVLAAVEAVRIHVESRVAAAKERAS